eukprot:6686208-Pyramimonas_sp.AAC.1
MRTPPLGPSVEPPYGATPLGPSVEFPMGPRNAVLSAGKACGHRRRSLQWSSLWGHEVLHWVGGKHADTATVAFGGAFCGATKLCTGWGNACGRRHWCLRWRPPVGPRGA